MNKRLKTLLQMGIVVSLSFAFGCSSFAQDKDKDQKPKAVSIRIGNNNIKLVGKGTNLSVFREASKVKLVVNKGKAEVTKVKPVETATGTGTDTGTGATAPTTAATTAAAEPEVTTLEAGQILTTTIASKPGAKINEEEKDTITKVCEEYIYPIHQKEVSQKKGDSLTFKWKSLCKNKPSTLQVASDSQFKEIIFAGSVKGESKTIVIDDSKDGPLYWRINHGSETGIPQSFTRYSLTPPVMYGIVPKGDGFEATWEKKRGVQYAVEVEGQKKPIETTGNSVFFKTDKEDVKVRVAVEPKKEKEKPAAQALEVIHVGTPEPVKAPEKLAENAPVPEKTPEKIWSAWNEVKASNSKVAVREVKEIAAKPTPRPEPIAPKVEAPPAPPMQTEQKVDIAAIAYPTVVKRFTYSFGAGVSNNLYTDGIVTINQISITPKVAVGYRPRTEGDRISLGAIAFFTALPFNSTEIKLDPLNNPALIDRVYIRYLGLNFRVSYLTPWLSAPWRMSVSTGWYYNTTFVTNSYFGYSGMNGPQLYPSIERDFNNGTTAGGYLKYSPISNGVSVLNIIANYEAAVGFYYHLPKPANPSTPRWSISLDLAHLTVKPALNRIYSNNFTLGTSLMF